MACHPAMGAAAHAASLAARPITAGDDPAAHMRLGKRMTAVLNMSHQKGQKLRVNPHQVLISTLNRQFSVQQVHRTILKSFLTDGHDPARPRFGVCCEVRDPQRLQELIAYNQRLAENSPLMPQVDPHLVAYEALSSNHYNVALRLVGAGHGSPVGDLAALRGEDATLAEAATNGHEWVILPEFLASDPADSDKLKRELSSWFNQDQNENQQLTDGELLRMALSASEQMMIAQQRSAAPGDKSQQPAKWVELNTHQTALAAMLQCPLKLNTVHMVGFCRWVLQFAAEEKLHLVHEFLTYWSVNVNPKALNLPWTFFDMVGKCDCLKAADMARFKVHLAQAMYTQEGAIERSNPHPSNCNLVTQNDLNTLEKQAWILPHVSRAMNDLHLVYAPHLEKYLKHHEANDLIVTCGSLLIRLVFGKKLLYDNTQDWSTPPVQSGKCTEKKILDLMGWWAKNAMSKHLGKLTDFGKATQLDKYFPKEAIPATEIGEMIKVPIGSGSDPAPKPAPGSPRVPAGAPGEGAGAPGEGAAHEPIKVGDKLWVIVRMSLQFLPRDKDNSKAKRKGKGKAKAHETEPPTKDNRKDLRTGTEVEVLEIPDDNDKEHKDKLKIKAHVMHKGEQQDLVEWALRKNLARTSDGTPLGGPMPSDEDEADKAHEPGILPEVIINGHETDHTVKRVDDWIGLQDDDSNATRLQIIKAKATLAMHLVLEEVRRSKTPLSTEDLEVVHRQNRAGVWRTEVWTKRKFDANELMIAPWTTEIKDRLWTTGLSTHLDFQRDAVPGGRMIALDGRGRSHLAHEDLKAHIKGETGNLYWAITRTPDAKNANLRTSFTQVTFPGIRVQVPGEPQKLLGFKVTDLPQIPVIVNPKPLEQHTKLTVLVDEKVENQRQQEATALLNEKEAKRKAAAASEENKGEGPGAKKHKAD